MAGENLSKLTALMARLRAPDGCPWDREQNYDSVKALLLEEAYEVIDTINARDFDALEDELGDLLFQVVFYAQLAAEENRFAIDDVIERVHAKLVRRHPHVFGDVRASTAEEALKSWLTVKEKEREAAIANGKNVHKEKSLLDGIAETLPATLEAYELGVRAAEVGFDWEKVGDLLDKIEEEVRELRAELPVRAGNDVRKVEEEVGDLLFAAANLARYLRSDAESCLRRANKKFEQRFRQLEREVARRGKSVRDCSAKELDDIWESVKRNAPAASAPEPDKTR
ncbi:MAG: nucleoside triphosphate pyrophosphohydrolase [Deltaproteobacteria bacterium]